MSRDVLKTLTYLAVHLTVAFTVGYLLTGSVTIAGGFALIEPCCNAVSFFFHEKAWNRPVKLFGFIGRATGTELKA